MVEMSGEYRGDLRCEVVHGPSGAKMQTDAPVDNEGLGRAFSPTDLVAAALGTCMMTILAIAARRRGVDIEGARFTVTKEMESKPRRSIGTIGIVVHLPASLSAKDRLILERSAHACPVKASLAESVRTPLEFVYD